MNRYVAVILAGGAATRMEGLAHKGLKTLLPLGNKLILQHIIDHLQKQSPSPERIGLNIHPDQRDLIPFGHWDVIEDTPNAEGERAGPLAGILAGLQWTQALNPKPQWMLSISGDTPDLPNDLVEKFLHCAKSDHALRWVVAASRDRLQPPISLWDTELLPPLEQAFAAGERKIDRFALQFPYKSICWQDCAFENLNHAHEYNLLKKKFTIET